MTTQVCFDQISQYVYSLQIDESTVLFNFEDFSLKKEPYAKVKIIKIERYNTFINAKVV
jgi:hypothetical protein